MILYKKLQAEYGENLKSVLTEKLYSKMTAKKSFYLHSTVHCGIDLNKIEYNYEHYLEDFKEHASKFTEKKTVFNILKSGHAPSSFYTPLFYEYLRDGFNYNSLIIIPANRKKLLEVIDIDCDLGRYHLRMETYKRHIEVYGQKEDLLAFKNDFKLKRPILWEKAKGEWHLAFDGLLCEYIKYQSRS